MKIGLLNNLPFLYAENNKVSEAIELWEESLPMVQKFFEKSEKTWIERYVELLSRLSVSYYHIGKKSKSKKYAEQILPRLIKLNQDNPEQWSKYYSQIQSIVNKQENKK